MDPFSSQVSPEGDSDSGEDGKKQQVEVHWSLKALRIKSEKRRLTGGRRDAPGNDKVHR